MLLQHLCLLLLIMIPPLVIYLVVVVRPLRLRKPVQNQMGINNNNNNKLRILSKAVSGSRVPNPKRLKRRKYNGLTTWGKNLLRSKNLNPVIQETPTTNMRIEAVFV
ncbi:unnamed protein product [Camellia sinensis]